VCRVISLVLLPSFFAACTNGSPAGSPPAPPAGTEVVKRALNASPRTSDFIFEASNSIVLHSAPLTVNGGDVGARGTGSGPFLSGGVAIDISSGAVVQTTHNVIADSIKLNTGATVGDIQTNRLVNPNAGPHGSVTPFVPLPALPAPAAVTPGTANLTVVGGKTVTASPGQFLTVSLGTAAILRLKAGTYQMQDLTIGTSGRIEALGTVQIRVANRLNAGSSFYIGPASGTSLTAKDIRIEVSGFNGTDGALGSKPKAAALASDGNIRALLLVPNGTLTLATGICAKGAFLAKDIDVGSAKYTFEDGFPNGATCTPASCDDHNPCTTDTCTSGGTCTHSNVTPGTSCGDGNACNGRETCNANGACQAGTPVVCAASDACHVAGICDQTTGVCSNPPAPPGTSCSDGNGCNGVETCDGSGACKPGTAVICTASDACHVAGTCDQATGVCSNPPAPQGTSCADGDACNGVETCDGSGACKLGTPVVCGPSDACHLAATCDHLTGACSALPAPVGTPCSDGNPCNGTETCNGAGFCTPGTPVTCTALDQCHDVGTCDPATGACSTPSKPNGTTCDDGSACTQTDTCQAGTCTGSSAVTCTALNDCHDVGTCTPASGQCSNPLKPAGTPCGSGGTCSAAGECVSNNQAPVVNAGADQTVDLHQQKPGPNFTLQKVTTPFNNPVGIEYHPPSNRMIVSVFYGNGQPHNFEFVNTDGTREQFSNISGFTDEVYFAIARDEGGGHNIGGFAAGEMFVGTGVPGVIARVSPDGATVDNPWVTLPGETGLMRGMLQFDRTGTFDGDLIVTTTAGNVWRVTSAGAPTMLANLGGGDWEGLAVVPNDPLRYGPWAGKIVVGDEGRDGVYTVDAAGEVALTQIAIRPENIMIVPPNENFFGVDFGSASVYGASASQFKSMVGDVLIAEEFGGALWHVQWDGATFQKILLARVAQWEHTAFGPAGISEIGPATTDVLLAGTATDDGQPPASTLTVTWSVVSGPGPVTFADSHAASTTATFGDPGTYVLRLTATDGTLSSSDDVTVVIHRITPLNTPPVANAGPDQTITIPEIPVLSGSAIDDGVPIGSAISLSWTQVSGPLPALIANSQAGSTPVLFVQSGTYVFRLDASDGELIGSDEVTITVNPETAIAGGSLVLSLSDPGPMPLGAAEFVTATLLDASATPVPNFPIVFTVVGANPGTATFSTDATGVAVLPYAGRYPGDDSISATATGFTQSLDSNTVTVNWLDIPVGTPLLTQGWIKSPIHQSTIFDRVPVVLSDQITLTSWTLRYWPFAHPADVHTLASGLSAAPGSTLATFDSTLLSNGSYVIDLFGTDDTGRQRESGVLVTIDGAYKPGRLVVELTDFIVPVAGLPIKIGRRYDSLEKDSVGDFGHGWSLTVGHPKLEVDLANNVAITMPDGRRTTFYFTGNFPILNGGPVAIIVGFLILTGYTPAPGTHGTLTTDGCPVMTRNPFTEGPPTCFPALSPSELLYKPTTYTYTDPRGTVYVMGASGDLKSITDKQGHSLTFTRNGITSSAGKNVTFVRDGQDRITNVDYPAYFGGEDDAARYQYDANGDLATVDLAKVPFVFFRTMHHTYDGAHRLLTSTDPNGNTVRTSTYDADGRLATDKDALGNVTSYTYDLGTHTNTTTYPDTGVVTQTFDPRGLVLSETDQLGHTTTHEYDFDLNETKQTNALGEVTTATYDSFGNQTSRTDLTGTKSTTYSELNMPATFTDRLGHTTTIDSDEDSGVPTRVTDEIGIRYKLSSTEGGLPSTVEDAAGKVAHIEYDVAGNPTARTDVLGRVTRATYDEAGHRLSQITARGAATTHTYLLPGWLSTTTGPNGYTIQRGYDANGNKTLEYDSPSLHGQTNYTYNVLSQLTQVRHFPDDTTVSYTRDFRGNALTMTDENGYTTTYEYDRKGNLTKTIFPDGTFTIRTYDALDRLSTLTDERGNTTSYEYQPGCACSDRVTRVIDPLGHATVTTFDANGRKTSVTDASGHTTSYTYDVRDNVVDTNYPDGTSTHDVYDSRERRVSTTDQTGATTLFGYDDESQLTSVTDPLGNVTHYAYDFDGNLVAVTDANNHTTTYEYDLLDRKTKRTLPGGQFETFAYDLVGNEIVHTDFRGKTTTMTVDSHGQMLTAVPDPSLGEAPHSYSYSPTGRRLSATDASGTTTYTYDARDRLLTKSAPAGTLTYTYDLAGNVATTRSSNANGTSVDYAWDAANQLITVKDNRLGGITTASYTPTRQPLSLTLPNGVGFSSLYDSSDRVTSMHWQLGASPTVASWAYTHNARGQRTSSTDITGRVASYTYDPGARLANETISGDPRGTGFNGALSYVLDGAGNRLARTSTVAAIVSQTASYNANDELASDTYDANGNTTGAHGHTYAYDFENRLISKDGGAVAITYDCDENRVAKTVGGVTTQYLVDDLNPTGYLQVLEEVVGGAVQTRYTYGRTIISETRDVASTPSTSYYGYDAHGNIAFLTDANGGVTDSYDYDAWGNLLATTGTTRNTRLFAGEEFDSDLGLISLRARYYNPDTGRFATLDPVQGNQGSPLSFNRYLYASSDPVNRLDPKGEQDALHYAQLAEVARLRAKRARMIPNEGLYYIVGAIGVTATGGAIVAGLDGDKEGEAIAKFVAACAAMGILLGKRWDKQTDMEVGGIVASLFLVGCGIGAGALVDHYYF